MRHACTVPHPGVEHALQRWVEFDRCDGGTTDDVGDQTLALLAGHRRS